jgi:hypothetical protein
MFYINGTCRIRVLSQTKSHSFLNHSMLFVLM